MQQKNDPINIIKSWLFPGVVTVLATVIWMDVTELKNDVKELLAQSNIDKTRIDGLEKQIDLINETILHNLPAQPSKPINYTYPSKELILNEDKKKKKNQYV